jgi:hypothetical protein
MTVSPAPAQPSPPDHEERAGRRSLRNAWISVAAIPVAFIVAMVAGEGLASLMGYDSGSGELAPLGVMLTAGVAGVLVMVAPAVCAAWFGLRARRQGVASGIVPAVVGIVVGAAAILSNTLPLLLSLR